MRLRIMTYNIFSGRDAFRTLDLTRAERVIGCLKPDICALNEVRMRTSDVGDCEQARALGEALHMHWAFAPAMPFQGGQYGIGMLSRFPILRQSHVPVPEVPAEEREKCYEPRVLMRCEIDVGRPIAVYTSHFGLSAAEQENATGLVLSSLDNETLPAVFMGDLNMTPDHPLIQKIAARLHDAAADKNFLTFHSLHPEIKIDYVFYSDEFTVLDACAPFTTASDHLPHVTDVELNSHAAPSLNNLKIAQKA